MEQEGARTGSCRYGDPTRLTPFNSQDCPRLDNYMITLLIGHIIILKAGKNFKHRNNLTGLESQDVENKSPYLQPLL